MSGMQIKYAELLSLSMEQLFYQNKICKQYTTAPIVDMLLVPTEECMDTMNRMDLIFRNTDTTGGFVILARVLGQNGAGNDLLRFPALAGDKLSFLMVLKNPELLNFSDLPAQIASNQMYYVANDVNDAAASRDNLHLSVDPSGVKAANDLVKKTNAIYRFHNPAVVAPGTAKVKHILTGAQKLPTSIDTSGGQSDLSFDLSLLPSGKCQLLINNILVDTFYFQKTNIVNAIFGVIEFMLSPTIAANYRIIEADRSLTAQRPSYKITLQNRKTTWRYAVHLQPNSPLYNEIANLSPADKTTFMNHLNIVTNDNAISFNKISATDTDFLFESQQTLALQEKYFSSSDPKRALNLTLKKYIGLGPPESEIKNFLPYPSTNNLDASNTPSIYSDIFLTL